MLVFSRNEGDGVSFPELDMAIEVLKIQGSRVRIGIKASAEIRVLRSELLGKAAKMVEPTDQQARHAFRNKMQVVSLSMNLAQRHLERGDLSKAELALNKAIVELRNHSEQELPSQVLSGQEFSSLEFSEMKFLGQEMIQDKMLSSETSMVDAPSKPRIRVLLVEDNQNESNLMAEILAMNHVDVCVVHDGAEALESLKTSIPDVVLLDMNMPNLDGKATIEEIRKNQAFRSLRVYAVTGANKAELGIKINQTDGVNEWFQKPVQPRTLIQALNSLRPHATAC